MKPRVIVVDDEPLARDRVRAFLAEEGDLEVVAECAEGVAAVRAIEEHRPDLVFLDVQMPRLNGFEVLEALDREAMPAVIFTTAHDQHALRAFEVHAVDYLLKPYKQARFKQALQRARERISRPGGHGPATEVNALLARLRSDGTAIPRVIVKSPDRILFLKATEIDHVEADGNYVQIHAGPERHMVRDTMAAMEARLGPAGFMRLSRSAIVNLARIRELKPLAAGEYLVVLQSGARLDMTCPLKELQERMRAG